MTIWIRIARDLVRNHLVQIFRYLADIYTHISIGLKYICKLIFGAAVCRLKSVFVRYFKRLLVVYDSLLYLRDIFRRLNECSDRCKHENNKGSILIFDL